MGKPIKNNATQNNISQVDQNDDIYLSKITLGHWFVLIVFWVVCCIGIWQGVMPFIAERHYRDGYHYEALNQMRFALDEYEAAVKAAPWETQYMMDLGKCRERLTEQAQAPETKYQLYQVIKNLYEHMIKLDAQNPWYKNRLASIALELEKAAPDPNEKQRYALLAKEMVFAAANNDHRNPLFALNLAYYLHRNNQKDAAIKEYLRVIEMDPGMLDARYNLASIYRERKQLDLAMAQYEAIYQINPDFQNIDLALSGMYILNNQAIKSIPYLESFVSRNPNHMEALRNLAVLHYQNKSYQKSAMYYKQLLHVKQGEVDNFFPFYIQSLVYANEFEEAKSELERYLEKHVNDNIARNQLSIVNRILEQQNKAH